MRIGTNLKLPQSTTVCGIFSPKMAASIRRRLLYTTQLTLSSSTQIRRLDQMPRSLVRPHPMVFPSLEQLSIPEVLFAEKAPYHLIVNAGHIKIVIEGSHSKSLELIAAYFQKWSRKNYNNNGVSIDPLLLSATSNLHSLDNFP